MLLHPPCACANYQHRTNVSPSVRRANGFGPRFPRFRQTDRKWMKGPPRRRFCCHESNYGSGNPHRRGAREEPEPVSLAFLIPLFPSLSWPRSESIPSVRSFPPNRNAHHVSLTSSSCLLRFPSYRTSCLFQEPSVL